MATMWRDAWLILRKDLRVEARTRITLHHVFPFVLTVVMLFAFALDADSTILRRTTAGLFWVTVVFASQIIVQRTSAIDRPDGIADAIRMSGLSPSGVFMGKVASLFIQLTVTEVVLAVTMVLLYDVRLVGIALIVSSIPLATLAISAVGTVYGALAAGLGGKESVLPVLLAPALAPVLLAATNSFGVAFGTTVGPGWRWVAMLGMLSVIYVVAGMATAPALVEET